MSQKAAKIMSKLIFLKIKFKTWVYLSIYLETNNKNTYNLILGIFEHWVFFDEKNIIK